MSNPSALQTAVQLATRDRDAAAQRLALARQGWIAAQVQLDQLESYAQETQSRWRTQSTRTSPEIMAHHYQFMERLTHATQLQSGVVAQQAATVKLMADRLRAAETRRESLRQLHATRESEQRRALDRREQKASDERAALQYRRLAGGLMGGG
ncbi:flagellar export protein FliJ [Variovorax humicola]|uniref:Flagellar FliJ protein n=1 Tax=Variovorax humicola TaxID=1769758 RepID=A0ABU8W834_9BURK